MKNQPFSDTLFDDLTKIIQEGKKHIASQINRTLTIVYWQVGGRIDKEILQNERAGYGQEIIAKLARKLEKEYGRGFSLRNLRRMIQFSQLFPDFEIVSTLSAQLSWSHFIEILPLKNQNSRHFYAEETANQNWSVRALRKQIERKAFERKEIAQIQLKNNFTTTETTFKDPYFLDFLGLKEGYLENDLENAILKELELFILELGKGFAFVEVKND